MVIGARNSLIAEENCYFWWLASIHEEEAPIKKMSQPPLEACLQRKSDFVQIVCLRIEYGPEKLKVRLDWPSAVQVIASLELKADRHHHFTQQS